MSYILDALKKADQQRQHAAAPTLRSAPQVAVETRKAPVWRYAALGFVVVGLLLLAAWLQLSPTTERARPTTVAATAPAMKSPEAPAVAPSPAPTAVPVLPAPPLPLPDTAANKPAVHAPPPASRSPAPVPPPTVAEPTSGHILAADELPLPVRQALPAMTVSLHAWSAAPKSRLVSINNRVLHEGDSPAEGVMLEEITPDGMILSFRGYRFRQGVR